MMYGEVSPYAVLSATVSLLGQNILSKSVKLRASWAWVTDRWYNEAVSLIQFIRRLVTSTFVTGGWESACVWKVPSVMSIQAYHPATVQCTTAALKQAQVNK
jgi:hypothetical protein